MLMDSDGDFALPIAAMIVGAAINVVTTGIAACVVGQDYTVKDAVLAAVTGAVGASGPAGPLVAGLISGSAIKTATKIELGLGTSAAIGVTCDFGSNLMSAGASKAYNSSVHASKKNKVNIQAHAIAFAIRIALYKAKSMKKKQNSRRKRGWIDLKGIQKRRTYN